MSLFSHKAGNGIELQLIQQLHAQELYKLMDQNRRHLRPWHPWIDQIQAVADVERSIVKWLQQLAANRGFHAGIWQEGRLCGVVNHLNVDWSNRSTFLSYWLDESHQGRGIMTIACREFVAHAFNTFKLNRVTIECATDNKRSRGIPERLGFQLEGIVRSAEWLHDHYADHAIYGLLCPEFPPEKVTAKEPAPTAEVCAAAN